MSNQSSASQSSLNSIELRSIERSLTDHPLVDAAFVAVYANDGIEQLVVYVVPTTTSPAPSETQLRRHMAGKLVDLPAPDAVVLLEKFPLTPSGDIDRQVLPGPYQSSDTGLARSLHSELLRELFAAVLDVPTVRMNDNFFELGGHSLLIARLVSRIRAVLEVKLSVRDLFDAPTVEMLTERLYDGHGGASTPMPKRTTRDGRLPITDEQRRTWFEEQAGDVGSSFNLPVAWRLSGPLDRTALEAALGDVVGRHEILRTLYHVSDGAPTHLTVKQGDLQSVLSAVAVTQEALPDALGEATALPFDRATHYPMRATLFELEPEEHVLLVVLHRPSADSWSADVVVRDLCRAYTARHAGRAPVWDLLPMGFGDYASRHLPLLGSEDDPGSASASQADYWRTALEGVPQELALPFDRVRPAKPSRHSGTVQFEIPAELHSGLQAVARQGRATMSLVLQTAFGALLTELGAGHDIPINVPGTMRTDVALDGVVGPLSNAVTLRVDTSGDPAFSDLLTHVRETAVKAHAHQRSDRHLPPAQSQRALFQVSMELRSHIESDMQSLGLSLAELPCGVAGDADLAFTFRQALDAHGCPKSLRGALGYDADLFDLGTAEMIATRLVQMLKAAAADPGQPIGSL